MDDKPPVSVRDLLGMVREREQPVLDSIVDASVVGTVFALWIALLVACIVIAATTMGGSAVRRLPVANVAAVAAIMMAVYHLVAMPGAALYAVLLVQWPGARHTRRQALHHAIQRLADLRATGLWLTIAAALPMIWAAALASVSTIGAIHVLNAIQLGVPAFVSAWYVPQGTMGRVTALHMREAGAAWGGHTPGEVLSRHEPALTSMLALCSWPAIALALAGPFVCRAGGPGGWMQGASVMWGVLVLWLLGMCRAAPVIFWLERSERGGESWLSDQPFAAADDTTRLVPAGPGDTAQAAALPSEGGSLRRTLFWGLVAPIVCTGVALGLSG
ncbi:MAG: hypothetical protein AB7K09_07855 [Planctomycetota bacterium]